MTPDEAARLLGVAPTAPAHEVRGAYRALIAAHHPDRAGDGSGARAATINEAYRVLRSAPARAAAPPPRASAAPQPPTAPLAWEAGGPPVQRADPDTLLVDAPADEAFRWLLDAAHDIGEITYVDRSMPIFEVLCRFEGEPATSLLVTLQGRGGATEVQCTVESIEARPAPPTPAVVDLLELAMHRRSGQLPRSRASRSRASRSR